MSGASNPDRLTRQQRWPSPHCSNSPSSLAAADSRQLKFVTAPVFSGSSPPSSMRRRSKEGGDSSITRIDVAGTTDTSAGDLVQRTFSPRCKTNNVAGRPAASDLVWMCSCLRASMVPRVMRPDAGHRGDERLQTVQEYTISTRSLANQRSQS